jgi:hypothetical protein
LGEEQKQIDRLPPRDPESKTREHHKSSYTEVDTIAVVVIGDRFNSINDSMMKAYPTAGVRADA